MSHRCKPRMTKQRKVILEELRKTTSHPDAEEVFNLVRKHMPRISLGTVYRNLDRLACIGLIRKIETGNGPMRFDGSPMNHYHIRCSCCGKVEDITHATDKYIERIGIDSSDYDITSHTLVFVGICPECKKRKDLKR